MMSVPCIAVTDQSWQAPNHSRRPEPSAPTLPPSYDTVNRNRHDYTPQPPQSPQQPEGLYPDLTELQNEANARNEEIRRRRLQRFQ